MSDSPPLIWWGGEVGDSDLGAPDPGSSNRTGVRVEHGASHSVQSEIGASLGGPIGDALPVPLAIIRPSDNTLLYANPAWDALFGYQPGELVGQPMEVVSPLAGEDRLNLRRAVLAALERDGVWHGRVLKQRRSGEQFWSMTHVSVANHDEHGPVWISLQSGAELDEGGAGLAAFEQMVGFGTWEVDLGARTARLSAQALHLFNLDHADEPLTLAELVTAVHPGDLPGLLAAFQAAEAGSALDLHFRVTRADRSVRLLHLRGVEVQSWSSERAYSGVIIDVTERHVSEDDEIPPQRRVARFRRQRVDR